MKHNLKNWPKKASPQAYEQWLKGFEAELRDRMDNLEIDTSIPMNMEKAIIVLIKEILGE